MKTPSARGAAAAAGPTGAVGAGPSLTAASGGADAAAAGAKSVVDARVSGLTAFDAFEAQLKGLCLKEYPCGVGSWVNSLLWRIFFSRVLPVRPFVF